MSRPLLLVEGLRKAYAPTGGGRARGGPAAVEDVSFGVTRGETLALVGESGAGKSTIARCLVRLEDPDAGRIRFDGEEIVHLRGRALRGFRRRVQIVFQDPHGSLNPRMRVGTAVREPLEVHGLARGTEADARVAALFAEVGLDPDYRARFPHELSGGQRQRVGIARALAVGPDLLVLDEPVSALDVSVQAQVLALLRDLQARHHLTYLFIAHDLAVVRQMADRIAVLYRGRIVEEAPAERLFADPRHPYTRALLSAVPRIEADARRPRLRLRVQGDEAAAPRGGCPFAPRCPDPRRDDRCVRDVPVLLEAAPLHRAACHFAGELPV
jgi:peptide/nickel transport system ATP-binding protein/oligopeptide transport system ATP-binding protein